MSNRPLFHSTKHPAAYYVMVFIAGSPAVLHPWSPWCPMPPLGRRIAPPPRDTAAWRCLRGWHIAARNPLAVPPGRTLGRCTGTFRTSPMNARTAECSWLSLAPAFNTRWTNQPIIYSYKGKWGGGAVYKSFYRRWTADYEYSRGQSSTGVEGGGVGGQTAMEVA